MHLPIMNYRMPHELGLFGAKRTHDVHTGIDLYCDEGEPIYAMKMGKVFEVGCFTGPNAIGMKSDWWEETHCIVIQSDDMMDEYILYGELTPIVNENDIVSEGQIIGHAKRVLKEDKGLPMTMLHLEHYYGEYQKGKYADWFHDQPQPEILNDPMGLLNVAIIEKFMADNNITSEDKFAYSILDMIINSGYDSYYVNPRIQSPQGMLFDFRQQALIWEDNSIQLVVRNNINNNEDDMYEVTISLKDHNNLFPIAFVTNGIYRGSADEFYDWLGIIGKNNNIMPEYEWYKYNKNKGNI